MMIENFGRYSCSGNATWQSMNEQRRRRFHQLRGPQQLARMLHCVCGSSMRNYPQDLTDDYNLMRTALDQRELRDHVFGCDKEDLHSGGPTGMTVQPGGQTTVQTNADHIMQLQSWKGGDGLGKGKGKDEGKGKAKGKGKTYATSS
ncbi:unnamed protein product [Polarella glacialis]|uniref:Uncharacterized protein n=1 Tax=Polarella glacialis TaxID=89957 RepID=A0A813E5R7_POLGL|nr:unnamed protein product [Polarella glacialis]CAE8624425.1 unnamed protein product [Polarella glacialis]CAE8740888.1 unnamed protein product [Polarella glacialis]